MKIMDGSVNQKIPAYAAKSNPIHDEVVRMPKKKKKIIKPIY